MARSEYAANVAMQAGLQSVANAPRPVRRVARKPVKLSMLACILRALGIA